MSNLAQNKPFGCRDLKAYEITSLSTPTYATGVDVPCVNALTFEDNLVTAKLEGDDTICATHAALESVKFGFDTGGINLDLYDVLQGATLTDSGSGSGAVTILDSSVADQRPYFGLIGQSYATDTGGDTLCIMYKCKSEEGGGSTFNKGQFAMVKFGGIALPSPYSSDTKGVIRRLINRTTAAAISTTWLSNPVHI